LLQRIDVKLALLIYTYFPFGGQQRDFMRILREALSRGHQLDVYAFEWHGEVPEQVNFIQVPCRGWGRLSRYRCYTQFVQRALATASVDAALGFSKMPGLDIYFAADSCFAHKARTQRAAYYRYTPRYRHFMDYERAVFGPDSETHSLLLSPLQKAVYRRYYPASYERMHELPPGISPDRQLGGREPKRRQQFRQEFGLAADEILLLQVGSGFRVKGVDRALRAIASLPPELRRRVRYILAGQDRPRRYYRLARRLGLSRQLRVFSGREDIMRFFAGADLLLHPAYEESAGYVLLEAAVAGLPVLTTASCGYATYIDEAGAGEVCAEPFSQDELDGRLASMLENLNTAPWSENGLLFGQSPDLYKMPQRAMDIIENLVENKSTAKPSL